ncbi:hypothetical protein L6452_41989 [Arctium lappa]|uniref:Uncharacterized protein n=1 Tax=Arctium lappa TaxID=4217 RepID=A0ACB8XHT1_ARCLA|nr:hypothetical protein L6452_41989 [Arctium lappa]
MFQVCVSHIGSGLYTTSMFPQLLPVYHMLSLKDLLGLQYILVELGLELKLKQQYQPACDDMFGLYFRRNKSTM